MEKKLVLNTDETIIRRSQEIGYGSSLSRSNNELILTSQAVILMKKNLFGKVSDIIRFPCPTSSSPTTRPRSGWVRRISSPPPSTSISRPASRASASSGRMK